MYRHLGLRALVGGMTTVGIFGAPLPLGLRFLLLLAGLALVVQLVVLGGVAFIALVFRVRRGRVSSSARQSSCSEPSEPINPMNQLRKM
jgi:hypothetical protein